MKRTNRLIAGMLALVMVLLMVPISQIRVNAATTTYTFSPSTLTATADKEAIPDGTKLGTDDYFTSVGTVTMRWKSGKGVSTIELGKSSSGKLQFTVQGTANVTVGASSTGGSNVSEVGLINVATNAQIANNEGITNVTGTSATTMTYTNLPAGTYAVVNPSSARNTRVHSVEVVETADAPVDPSSEPSDPSSEPSDPSSEPTVPSSEPVTPSSNKIDVWDFGAEQLDAEKYNNMLTVDEINSWYPAATPGSTGVTTANFTTSDGQLSFNGDGKTNNRLRTDNTALTRYDAKYLVDDNGVTYHGYIYSNSGSRPGIHFAIQANAGDILTFVVGEGNNAASEMCLESPSGEKVTAQYVPGKDSKHAQITTFYAKETGTYKFYYVTNKMVVARIYREHTHDVTVTGTVTAPAELTGYSLVFTNTSSGEQTVVPVTNGTYTATLRSSYSYAVSLQNANGYIISAGDSLTLDKQATEGQLDVTVKAVPLVTLNGAITGLTEDALAKLQIRFVPTDANAIYQPQIVITGTTYTVELEQNMSYQIVAEGINDYELTGETVVTYAADATADLAFAAKPTYAVTIVPVGATLDELANATFLFTNLNEEGYAYTFTGPNAISLRDGVYSVEVQNTGSLKQKLTSNLKVSGAPVSKTIGFESDVSVWDFSAADFANVSTTAGAGSYNGLEFTNAANNKNTYLLSNAGTIRVPVKGECMIRVSACYQYSFYFVDNTEPSVDQMTGSTGQIDTFDYHYTGAAGMVEITVLGTSYLTKIEVISLIPYQPTLTVGATGCDYTTINDALAAVRKMDRPNGERVTILIQPGNYEEMLVVDVDNVTLKNASAAPSIDLTDSGVNIAPNAVRITHYYGHGYTYYSMGSDCKYSDEILAVNKENGYPSFVNPGSGTTNGSYWNATVVINANGFQAEGIIFENSFNQYISEKAANDVLVPQSGAKEPASAPRTGLTVGSTAVQNRAYVERAAALAIYDNCKDISFDFCKFIGRQDTLYGGRGAMVAFYNCSIYGAVDYIFGGMTAVFAKCYLVFNTSDVDSDAGYITAPQQSSGRGYLMYNCTVTSTVPGVDTASTYASKPGFFGRPWAAKTGEAVFYETVIEKADAHWGENLSLIDPVAWKDSLSGQSSNVGEYHSHELSGVDNSASRAPWANTFDGGLLADGTPISVEAFTGADWAPFEGKDMTIEVPGVEPETIDVSGTVTSASTEAITVELLSGDSVVATVSAENGAYRLANVADGTYTLRFTQTGMVSAECEVTVSGASVTKDVTLYHQDDLVTIAHSLDLQSEIGVRYYLTLTAGVTNPTMTAWRTETERVENVSGTLTGSEYLFVYNVYAMYMTDDITAQFTMEKDGVRYTLDDHIYSVQTYCEHQLGKDTISAESKDLFAKLLNYGAYAQRYFNYRTDDLADANLATLGYAVTLDASAVSAVESTLGTDFAGTVKGHFNGNTLRLEDVLGIRYYMVADETVGDVYMAYRVQGTDQWQYVKAEMTPDGSEYYADISGIVSYDIKNVYEAYFCEKTGDTYTQITQTKTYGAEIYAYRKLNSANENLRNCVIALMMYCDAAKVVFGA